MNRNIPIFWFYLVVAFGIICVVPWARDKSGNLSINVASVYANQFQDWELLLTGHIIVALALAGVATLLDRSLRRWLKKD